MPPSLPVSARVLLVLGALNLALGVALGAAGLHGLKAQLAANDPGGWFQSALHYHQLHALGLLAVGIVLGQLQRSGWLTAAGVLMLAGIALFSGSLYLRSIAGIHLFHAVTPFGGAAFILAWLCFAWGVMRGATPQPAGHPSSRTPGS